MCNICKICNTYSNSFESGALRFTHFSNGMKANQGGTQGT